jgi:hypothetical protein
MEAKAILRVEKIKNWGQAAAAGGHMARTRRTENADPRKKNELLVGSGDPAADLRNRIEASGVRIGKRSVIGMDVLLSASPEFFCPPGQPVVAGIWDPLKTKAFKSQALKWAQDYFGKNNVVSAIYHLDESTPHLTIMAAPIDDTPREKGSQTRLNAARWLDGRKRLADMQTSFAEAVAPLGLQRGIEGSQAKHTTIREFYSAAIVAQPLKLTPPRVSAPPLILTPQGREEWAQSATKEIQGQVKNTMAPVIHLANSAALATKKKKEYQATADMQAKKLRELSGQLRDIDLPAVAEALGLEPDAHDPHKWRGQDMAISITGPKFWDHKQNKGGGGSIDLAMHAMSCDYRQALSWLADRFADQAAGAVRANAGKIVSESKKERKPFTPPAPAPSAWPAARKYLCSRGLDPNIIDSLYDQGLIYASEKHGYINAVFLNARNPDVAEIRGISGVWRGIVAGSRRDSGGFRVRRGVKESKTLVLVEAPVDAISYCQLHPEGDYTVMSTSGVRPDAPFIRDAHRAGWRVICAFDADQAGDDAASEMIKRYAEIERERPTVGKDWNDQLQQTQQAEARNNKDKLAGKKAVQGFGRQDGKR